MPREYPVNRIDISKASVINGDCAEELKKIESKSVDLIFTSPPYAEQRKGDYSSISPEKYVEWFSPIAHELKRVLKDTGSFFLNIAPHCDDGERQLYVMELVLHLRNQIGFKFQDEIVWYKSANPRKWDHRLKNAWEPIFQFSVGPKPFINHDNVMIKTNSAFVNKRGCASFNDLTGNVGGYHDIADQGVGLTPADNVLYFPTALLVKDKFKHPAKFPLELVEFFVRGYCPPDGIVLDPFSGSGMTALAALNYNRNAIAIEIDSRFAEMIKSRLEYSATPKNTAMSGLSPNIFKAC